MFDVIEHLFDPRAVLEATRRALVPGGLLVVSTPNFRALSRFVLGVEWAVLSPLEHLYYFTERTLTSLIDACGFTGVAFEHRYRGWGPMETMNYQYTHAPGARRARLYGAAVTRYGGPLRRLVQAAGRADALLCVSRAGVRG
jgi:hypothetical protein